VAGPGPPAFRVGQIGPFPSTRRQPRPLARNLALVVPVEEKGREVPLLETSRYGRMGSSRLLAAACCPEGMPPIKPDAESGGPRSCESPLPRDQDSLAEFIPVAARVSAQLSGM
jgi:hypothetical protein